MTEIHTGEIKVLDLADKLTGYLAPHSFVRLNLNDIPLFDRIYLIKRDKREHGLDSGLSQYQRWRSDEDYLVFDNDNGTLAYIRPNPCAPTMPHAIPFEIHFRTSAPSELSIPQAYSLAVPQRNLKLLLDSLHSRGYNSISHIGDMGKFGPMDRLYDQLGIIEGDALPIHLFHSTYLSIKREAIAQDADKEKMLEELAKAIGSVIISSHLFSRKQIAYYQASLEVDRLFSESALVG